MEEVIRINDLAERAYQNALKRRKVKRMIVHNDTVASIGEEYLELILANECLLSEHLPKASQVEEELTDIFIACMTELRKRNVDVEKIVLAKIEFNEQR